MRKTTLIPGAEDIKVPLNQPNGWNDFRKNHTFDPIAAN